MSRLVDQEALPMQSEAALELIRESDPNALSLVMKNREVYYIAKRIIDIVIASILLLVFSPLMLLIALLIKLYSPGPIFFVQERVGAKRQYRAKQSYWRKATFRCYKFRTMRSDSDASVHQAYIRALIENDQEKMVELQGQDTKIRKLIRDPRITRPGKFLRKLSLDELPQLWNVLRGEMSLVGPRPAIPYEVELYKPWYLGRLETLPGITGLQQVIARSTFDFDQQMHLDIQYIQDQSLWLDIKIMLKTPFVVISTKGAQ
jgi:lipopolysaccharide/colanic/teichoic acid biosynthesis glycosyltransferase